MVVVDVVVVGRGLIVGRGLTVDRGLIVGRGLRYLLVVLEGRFVVTVTLSSLSSELTMTEILECVRFVLTIEQELQEATFSIGSFSWFATSFVASKRIGSNATNELARSFVSLVNGGNVWSKPRIVAAVTNSSRSGRSVESSDETSCD